jgi:hypothetical protein
MPKQHEMSEYKDGYRIIAYCQLCGGEPSAGTMPTECPGSAMTSDVALDVAHRRKDYRGGKWETL